MQTFQPVPIGDRAQMSVLNNYQNEVVGKFLALFFLIGVMHEFSRSSEIPKLIRELLLTNGVSI